MGALVKAGMKNMRRISNVLMAKCEGKPTYEGPQEAHAALVHRDRRGKGKRRGKSVKRVEMRAYSCKSCGKWHIGTHNGVETESYRQFATWAEAKGYR